MTNWFTDSGSGTSAHNRSPEGVDMDGLAGEETEVGTTAEMTTEELLARQLPFAVLPDEQNDPPDPTGGWHNP